MNTNNDVITLKALSAGRLTAGDNFIYLWLYDETKALAVDAGDAEAILRAIKEHKLTLTHILLTHTHYDHTAGAAKLKQATNCRIIGTDKNRIPDIDQPVADGEILTFAKSKLQVIATPGHTRTSACYYVHPLLERPGLLFTGDTLFVAGCGRVFECDAQTMYSSLLKLASLPDQTLVYPGHDYTIEDYEFALQIEPDNKAVKDALQHVRQQIAAGGYTVPSTIGLEKTTNPFLRAQTAQIKAALNMPGAPDADVFAEFRRRKDFF